MKRKSQNLHKRYLYLNAYYQPDQQINGLVAHKSEESSQKKNYSSISNSHLEIQVFQKPSLTDRQTYGLKVISNYFSFATSKCITFRYALLKDKITFVNELLADQQTRKAYR